MYRNENVLEHFFYINFGILIPTYFKITIVGIFNNASENEWNRNYYDTYL